MIITKGDGVKGTTDVELDDLPLEIQEEILSSDFQARLRKHRIASTSYVRQGTGYLIGGMDIDVDVTVYI